jgi:8-oxo-dGTP pyrophosphatase MutT (NUDIX family)
VSEPVPEPSTTVTTVAEGIARISWSPGQPVDVVRHDVAAALVDHARVEALVDPDDEAAQRVATWSGLRREGIMRGVTVEGRPVDRIVYARLATDTPVHEPEGFRALLNSFLPRKRAISQMLLRDPEGRVLLCQLTYKQDWDLPGGVVEVGESPRLAVAREVEEELGLTIPAGPLVLTDWLPPWSGWDDALCLVFDGGVHDASLTDRIVRQTREIRTAEFCTLEQAEERCADFTARRITAALRSLHSRPGDGPAAPAYTESGRS